MSLKIAKYSLFHALVGGIGSFYLGALGVYYTRVIDLDSRFLLEDGVSTMIVWTIAILIFIIGVYISSAFIEKISIIDNKDTVGWSSIIMVVFLFIVNYLGKGDYLTIGIYLVIFYVISRSNLT